MATAALDQGGSGWHSRNWVLALAVPAVLFAGEAGSLLAFEHFRAPNASLVIQLGAMLCFFLLLAAIPRLLWELFSKRGTGTAQLRRLVVLLIAIGIGGAAVHLALFAAIKMALYASPEWMSEPRNIATSVGESWLNYGGIWLAVYGLLALGTHAIWSKRAARQAKPYTFAVRRNDRLVSIASDEVLWIEAEGNYLELHCARGNYTIRDSLSRLDKILSEQGFVRSHRSALVNAKHVRGIRSCAKSSSYRVILKTGEEAPLGRRRLAELRQVIS